MSKYLITFDMNTSCLKENYHSNNYNNAYADIGRTLKRYGFNNIQGSVYLGSEGVSEAHGTIAIQELTATYDWFYSCVSNIKFYRLESDLDAQFIADGVHAAKERFRKRFLDLEESLKKAGLTNDQIQTVMAEQKFDFKEIGNN
ncbi:hypothetical protein ACVBEG_15710 [Pseudomonas sp. GG8]